MRSIFLRRLLCAAALCGAAAATHAEEPATRIGGVSFEPRIQLDGQTLQINGAGAFAPLRLFGWIKGYAAALYLGQRAGSAEQVVAQGGPKRLQMHMLLDVPVDEFIKAFHKGAERNTPAEQFTQLADRMARFDAMLRPLGEVKKGDLVNLDFVPGQGLLFTHNGRLLGPAIPGADLYGALLRCFIGERPVDQRLRAALLGKPG